MKNDDLEMIFRHRSAACLRNTGVAVLSPTLRDPPTRIPVRTSGDNLAFLHQRHRCLQYPALEPSCLPGTFSLLHV